MAADEIGDELRRALVGDQVHVDRRLVPEHLGAHVRAGAQGRGREVELAGIGLGERNQTGNVLRLYRRMHEQHQRQLRDQAERREVLARIEAGIDVERRVDADAASVPEHQRVAVGRRLDHRARADDAGAGAAVLNHHGLAEAGAQPVGHDARHGIVAAAGRERHDQRDVLGRIVLGCLLRLRRQHGADQRGGDRGDRQRLPEFHGSRSLFPITGRRR